MRGALPNSYHSYTFFLFIVLALFRHVFSTNTLSSTETLTISSNRTIVSPGDVFELGFFKTTTSSRNGDRWYLGIWYKSTSDRAYVWVANRDSPLSKSTGTLKISYANLVLLDHSNTPVWSTNLKRTAKSPVVAELLANGNFVLRDSKRNVRNRFLWQSFDFPVNTLLPEMKIGRNLKTGHKSFLSSWRSPHDPSSGDFAFKLDTQGLPEFYLYRNEFLLFRSGSWDGVRFSGMPTMQKWSYFGVVNNFIENREEVAYSFKVTNQSLHSRFTLTSEGLLQMFQWDSTSLVWNLIWILAYEECDLYQICGPYSYCDMKTSPTCNCIKGFVPKNVTASALGDISHGCVRKSRLNCHGNVFFLVKRMKLPDTSTAIVDNRIGLHECEERCSQNCNCTGFANKDIRNGGSGCVIWTRELRDMRNYGTGGQDLYVKVGLYD
ncbi:hypothetical protein CARUB_v10016249mg [Capsella rubella]|uniref:S-locus glycoprotein n=1 Tax=Capsella rubella TaxID=81985 RepID=R0GB39_9BRAS|nr:hypothetical protein CARUB_v10016249mg [Capsella rubella]